MQRITTLFPVFLFLLLLPKTTLATHIVGGEMTYTCLGNSKYEIRLSVFRDCYHGIPWFDDPAHIGIYDYQGNFIQEIIVHLDPALNDTLNPSLLGECFATPPDVCVNTTTYTTAAILPFRPGGYQIVYQRCCRNHTIANIYNPEGVGATFSIDIGEEALLACNSSPVFNNWPPLYICVNQPFSIDQSALDPDGDSLVYRLCNPLDGASTDDPMPLLPYPPPYDTVPWINPPYNLANMLNGLPGGVPMTINPHTGLLEGTPNTIGQFVIGICVEEYRNGQLIGTNRRDYQVNVGVCSILTAAFFAPELVCDTLTVLFENQSNGGHNFLWNFGDPGNPDASSNLYSPQYTFPDTGIYTVTLIVDQGINCTDTFSQQIQFLPHSLFASFSIENVDCTDSLTVQITDSSLDTFSTIVSWEWELVLATSSGPKIYSSTQQHPQFVLKETGIATLTLRVVSENGCSQTLEHSFPALFFKDPVKPDTISFCIDGSAVPINPGGALPGASYLWQPPDFLDDPTSPNPHSTPDSTITYTVLISDPSGECQMEKTVTVIVSPQVEVSPHIDTLLRGQSVQIFATDNPDYQYVWSPSLWLDADDIPNPVSTPESTITYFLLVADQYGCYYQDAVLLVVTTICDEPYIFIPTGFTPNGDGRNDTFKVIGNNLEEVYIAVYNRWGEKVFESSDANTGWDGTYKGKPLPPDAYGYYVKVKCEEGLEFFKKGNVTLLR